MVDVGLVHINPSAGYAQVESFDEADRDLVSLKVRPHVRAAIHHRRLMEISPDVFLRAGVNQAEDRETLTFQVWIAPGSDHPAHIEAVVTPAENHPICRGSFSGVAAADLADVLGLERAIAWAWLAWCDEPIFLNDPGLTKN